MKILLSRLTGILLVLAAIAGLLIAITSLISIWQFRPAIITTLQSNLDLLDDTLVTTSEGLLITQESLIGAKASLQAMQSTLQTTSKTMQSTEPLISSLSDLAAQDLPAVVRDAQVSLDTAAESAQVIDTVLRALSFLPGINYNPNTPLATSLDNLSTNMDNLPETFIVMETNLEDTSNNLKTIQVDLLLMIDALRQIETSLADSETVITNYLDSVTQVQNKIETLSTSTPRLINTISLGGSIFMIWLAVAQLSLLTQGWQLLSTPEKQPPTNRAPSVLPSRKVASSIKSNDDPNV